MIFNPNMKKHWSRKYDDGFEGHELDSTRPPSGDINLGPDYFSGNVVSLRGSRTSPEFQWLAETSGAWNAPDESRQKARKPKWARARGGREKLSRQLADMLFAK